MKTNNKKSNPEDEKKIIDLEIELNEEGELLARMPLDDGYIEFDWDALVNMEHVFKELLEEEEC